MSRGPEDGDSKERERKLDEAIEMTFPASDPIAVGNPTGTEALTQSVRTTHGLARVVTVFGGSGFLGRRIVGHLRAKGFAVRAASRHPKPQKGDDPQLSSIAADIHDRASIDIAVACQFDHDDQSPHGENLFWGAVGAFSPRSAVTAWYEEIGEHDFSKPERDDQAGHFTQVVWRSTKQLGSRWRRFLRACCDLQDEAERKDIRSNLRGDPGEPASAARFGHIASMLPANIAGR